MQVRQKLLQGKTKMQLEVHKIIDKQLDLEEFFISLREPFFRLCGFQSFASFRVVTSHSSSESPLKEPSEWTPNVADELIPPLLMHFAKHNKSDCK